ncbi:MAG TPA: Re/Si-specific NAD(P)(+) transhydrogenase subunit alpha [Chloroflexota bacterium]|nr:Re/Si-specific NAD(P)(+) transhydrogenase subunit alpha [Chloroflexota bacterium]
MDEPPPAGLTVGVPKERVPNERRVALVPDAAGDLIRAGLRVIVESGAGDAANLSDDAYREAGAEIVSGPAEAYDAEIVAKVQPPLIEEIELFRPGSLLLSFLESKRDADLIERLADRGVRAFSFNAVPRVTRAQSMDALSAMSTVAGYKAVLIAADTIGRFFPLLMTAAGTVPPARVVVIGAGVAGLQALATARRLGAVTFACDARPAVREQIQSVGATFIDMSVPAEAAEGQGGYAKEMGDEILRLERDAIRDDIAGADVVISTAQVPGARAPLLIDEAMVEAMRPGSVIVDLAAETGGNCELSVPGETVERHGVTILAPFNLPSTVPVHASQMYARNVVTVIKYLTKAGTLNLDPSDEIVSAAVLTAVPAAT